MKNRKVDGGYLIVCKRCGRTFFSRHANALYCDIPSKTEGEIGKTCRGMRRVESKQACRAKAKAVQGELEKGLLLMTLAFGCIPRSEYLEKFRQAMSQKYKLDTYAKYQTWASENVELLAQEYSMFQEETGLQSLEGELEN